MPETHNSSGQRPHVAVFPSAGMGHLTPHLRVAAMFASRGCKVTIITAEPSVSAAESAHLSTFFSTHPHIQRLQFQVLPCQNPKTTDPFFIQWESIHNSCHLLLPPLLLSLSPPISALVSDPTILAGTIPVTDNLGVPNYVAFTSSARFNSFLAYLPSFKTEDSGFPIPGLSPYTLSTIPPPFFNLESQFCSTALRSARFIPKAAGIFMNTFEKFEPETISALNGGRVLSSLPHVYPIGPLKSWELKSNGDDDDDDDDDDQYVKWLNTQSVGSVVYVSFGSRTAMSKEQIRELGNGLEKSGCPFLWVVKVSKVDKEEKDEMVELLGDDFVERTKGKGYIANGWVDQEEILNHPAIGGFVSHCGWNSVMETARVGVPILAWPLHGDQRVNGEVVESAGLGRVMGDWGWVGERLVSGEEIGEKVRDIMSDEKLRSRAANIAEEARKAWDVDGSSEMALRSVIDMLKQKV